MIHLVLSWLWNSAFAQFGLAGIVLIGAAAAFLWLGDVPGVRHIAVAVASVCIIFLFLAPKLYIEGIRYEKAKWDAAEAAAAQRAADARQQAESEIPPLAPGITTPAPALPTAKPRGVLRHILHPRRVRNDSYDRDH